MMAQLTAATQQQQQVVQPQQQAYAAVAPQAAPGASLQQHAAQPAVAVPSSLAAPLAASSSASSRSGSSPDAMSNRLNCRSPKASSKSFKHCSNRTRWRLVLRWLRCRGQSKGAPPPGKRSETYSVLIPSGKLGIILSPTEPIVLGHKASNNIMKDKISPGDRIISVDGVDVTDLNTIEVHKLLAGKADCPRPLVIMKCTMYVLRWLRWRASLSHSTKS